MAAKYFSPLAGNEMNDLVCQGGIVTGVTDGVVQVLVDAQKGCEACGSKGHCGALFGGSTTLEIRSDRAIAVGQHVEIGMRPAAVLGASTLLFMFPTVSFIIGIVAGYWLAGQYGWNAQWSGLACGLIAGAASFFSIHLLTPRLQRSGSYEPVITKVFD